MNGTEPNPILSDNYKSIMIITKRWRHVSHQQSTLNNKHKYFGTSLFWHFPKTLWWGYASRRSGSLSGPEIVESTNARLCLSWFTILMQMWLCRKSCGQWLSTLCHQFEPDLGEEENVYTSSILIAHTKSARGNLADITNWVVKINWRILNTGIDVW